MEPSDRSATHIQDSKRFRVNNPLGVSIVEILVAMGIMMIVMSGIISMTMSQHKEARAISEKLAILDAEKLLISSLANGTICTAELASITFNPSGPHVIDTTNISAQVITLPQLHASPKAGSPALVVANQSVSPMAPQLLVDSIQFKNFVFAGLDNNYLADLEISFKNSVRTLLPITIKMNIKTDPTDPPNAKKITNCLESGQTGSSYRYVFTTSQSWTVPPGVKSAFVTMAGGGGSGAGWRVVNAVYSGHSGGYVFSHPVNLVPGETLSVVIGKGGKGYAPIKTGVLANPGPPYYIYTSPGGDDGLGGYPGTASQLISPTMGTLLECAGGSGVQFGGIDNYNGGLVAGNVNGGLTGSGVPAFPSPNRVAAGAFATANGPGACGPDGYGKGNRGPILYDISSGYYPGGTTPFGYGTGGDISRSGCYVNPTMVGTCVSALDGKDGVVYIDVWQ